MQNMTADYRDILPDNQFMYVEGGMQLYTEPNSDAVSSLVQGLDIALSDVLTFNSSLDRVYVLIPTATESYQWVIHGEYSASLEATVDISWNPIVAPDGSTVYPPEIGVDETITQFDESTFTYVIYNRTTQTYRAVQVWTEPEMDSNFWDNEQEVFNQNYAIRTTDDVLRQLWIRQCGGTSETYSRVYAEECFRRYYGNAMSDALSQWVYSGRSALMAISNIEVVVDQEALELWESVASQSPDLTMSDMQSRGVLGLHLTQEVIAGRLNNLSLEAILELYTALLSPTYESFGEDAIHLQDEASYIEALRNALIWEAGGVGDTSGFVPDLATQDWLDENPDYASFNALFDNIVNLIWQASVLGIFFGRFRYPAGLKEVRPDERYINLEHETIVNMLQTYIRGFRKFTYDDLVRLSIELSEEFSEKAQGLTLSPDEQSLGSGNVLSAFALADSLSSYGQGYEDRIALDNLRAVIFDPAWNPTTELAQLETLNGLIAEMPTSILGVDVSFAQAGMQEYHDLMLHQVQWHMQMQQHLANIDAEMLRRQAEGMPWQTLWWLGEFALAFLFEPLDWLITIRDIGMGIANGNLSAWDFLGFLPILTNRLGDIAQLMARSDVDEYGQFAEQMGISQHLGLDNQGLPRGFATNEDALDWFNSMFADEPIYQVLYGNRAIAHYGDDRDILRLRGVREDVAEIVLGELNTLVLQYPEAFDNVSRIWAQVPGTSYPQISDVRRHFNALGSVTGTSDGSGNLMMLFSETEMRLGRLGSPGYPSNFGTMVPDWTLEALNFQGLAAHEGGHIVHRWLRAELDEIINADIDKFIITHGSNLYNITTASFRGFENIPAGRIPDDYRALLSIIGNSQSTAADVAFIRREIFAEMFALDRMLATGTYQGPLRQETIENLRNEFNNLLSQWISQRKQ